jgi:hypothetical protein
MTCEIGAIPHGADLQASYYKGLQDLTILELQLDISYAVEEF